MDKTKTYFSIRGNPRQGELQPTERLAEYSHPVLDHEERKILFKSKSRIKIIKNTFTVV
jgi:hypothetical protein